MDTGSLTCVGAGKSRMTVGEGVPVKPTTHSAGDTLRRFDQPSAAVVAGAGAAPSSNRRRADQGGKMLLHTADPNLRVKLVTATVGKAERAAPVAMLFEAGRAVLHGRFPELEAELLGMIAGGGYEGPGGPGRSPDRADAMVWALTELMLGREGAELRVRQL